MFGQLKAKYVESQLFFADIYEMVMFPGLLVPIPDREARVVEMYEKWNLECVFLAMVTWFRLFRHVLCSVNVTRFHFLAVFWNRATPHTPVVARKCRESRFGGMK